MVPRPQRTARRLTELLRGGAVAYDAAEYPGTCVGLERAVVLPWGEFYTEERLAFIADAVQEAVRRLANVAA